MMLAERVTRSLRHQVRERAKGFCEYCRAPDNIGNSSFHCEHILPQKVGGETALDNLAWACPWCNAHKHAKTHARDRQTGRNVPLFNPRQKRWKRHFTWSENFLTIIGRTQTGRATVDALNLNRPERVNLRRALRALGEHPPKID